MRYKTRPGAPKRTLSVQLHNARSVRSLAFPGFAVPAAPNGGSFARGLSRRLMTERDG
jgi:hypothetical protein